ncbi:hypothetical protein M408DRAFT_204530 [Serendipita vermifera MAFF 305830]|uniref:Uncharacterized protein n=2 Tax=Serendipita vermifera MAFF 305830 TaxID=933852 RepID=A0A0C2X9B2_SERVB|nr:hypothetical protein M408DRAFT_204530 [Serendipita vermifera MAFF 305830]
MASDYDAHDAILHHIYKQTQGEAWFKPTEESMRAGVALRIETAPPRFRVFPYENLSLAPFEAAVRGLNPLVAVKLRSASIHAALLTITEDAPGIFIDSETRIQVLDDMSLLPCAEKEQYAAFIRDERVLVCWADNLDAIIPTCKDLEDKLIALVWKNSRMQLDGPKSPSVRSGKEWTGTLNGSMYEESIHSGFNSSSHAQEKNGAPFAENGDSDDKESNGPAKRPTRLFAPIYNGLGAALGLALTLEGLRKLLIEYWTDGQLTRFSLIATFPFLFCVSLFFYNFVVILIAQSFGPVSQFHQNSKYYSAIKPAPNPVVDDKLPHITIQMPVYKESLTETIAPSCESLKKAMQTYARQGGTSTIMICDDGMQLLDDSTAAERQRYYANHGIGWVARPGHSSEPDGFKRAGRFKKASNMNYALKISLKMEEHLTHLMRDPQALRTAKMASQLAKATQRHQNQQSPMYGYEMEEEEVDEPIEELALRAAMDDVFAETGNRFQPWGAGGRALRVGEIILIVDSDTIVPEDCLRDAAREMAESPELGVIQHESDVMQVSHNYFENGIAHFTRRVNKAISFAAANGEVAAFVGHNAFLRWSAIQDVAFIDPADGERKIWSETNVSEDFDMALRLQLGGYTVRWASYSEGGFKEGVSLTCDDELNRWEKYSYGCSELIFNPFIEWFTKGPINKQLRTFVWSDAPVHYKFSMMAYMFSYYGIAGSFTLSLLNYLLLGWQTPIDGMYLQSFEIWVSVVLVFPICGNIAHTLLEYRLGQRSLISAFWENIMWMPFFLIFFGGLSIHLSKAILAHLFSYNITWGATKKEVERSNFFLEVPKILVRFRVALVLSFLSIAAIVVMALPFFPADWAIPYTNWSVITPLAIAVLSHILYPIVLNPYLMVFSY